MRVALRRASLFLLLTFMSAFSIAQEKPRSDLIPELLSEDLRAWSDEQEGVFRVGVESTFRPYIFSEDGEISGVGGDYLRLLSERLDIEFVTVEFENFADILQAARQREIDLIPFILDHPERREFLSFTTPFFSSSDRVFMRNDQTDFNDLGSLAGQRVGDIGSYIEKKTLI